IEAETQQQQRARTAELEGQQRQAAYEQRMAGLEAICQRVIPELTAFISQRGASAQRLIQARDPGRFIFIAGGEGGGGFWSVVFSVNGLEYVVGHGGGYGGEPTFTERRLLSPEEAARKAIIDYKCREPEKLVERLINSIDCLAR
ncbi:MAG TPA: hypothetical protein VFT59_02600, partial [Candidatus Saccharimonadales bacterium]|nr:hypothetical protein [Candidatus Saccharimonadales bacterium]